MFGLPFRQGMESESRMGNAFLQAAQISVARWHRLIAPETVLHPLERGGFFPSPVFNVSVGEGKIDAVLMARVREVTPVPVVRGIGLKDEEGAAADVLRMIVDEHKRLGRPWLLKIGVFADDQRDGADVLGGG